MMSTPLHSFRRNLCFGAFVAKIQQIIGDFLNHAQSKVRVLLSGRNPCLQYSVILLKSYRLSFLSIIIDLFTFFTQSVMFTNRVSPPTET